jgi:cellulose synthase/poly-beta-1,6-N-acetylglucosamine synthase-like glycosyltransferase
MSGPTPSASLAVWVFWLALLGIVYVYFGYPLLIALAARLRPRPVNLRPGHRPAITVAVAAYNEAAHVAARIENLLAQDYPAGLFDILVVSDGSTDGTDDILERLAAGQDRLRVLTRRANAGKAAALNDALAAATGELIVFADARQRFAPDVLTRLAENFADPQVGSVSGELILTQGEGSVAAQVGLYWRYEKAIRRAESACGSMLGATGAIYAIRRALWRPLPPGTLLDDFLTPMRIVLRGERAIFDGRARAYDRVSTRAGQEFRRKARTLAGNYQAFAAEPGLLLPWRNPATWFQVCSHKFLRLMVPWALLALLAASLAAPGGFYLLAALAQAAFYGVALAGMSRERAGQPIRWRLAGLAWTFAALNAAAAAGLWIWLRGDAHGRVWKKAYAPPQSPDSP